jgi:homocysteine S-methyltransferase
MTIEGPTAKIQKSLAANELVVLDGAMGSEIHRRGIETTLPLWSASALITNPDVIMQIHADFIKAGADIITTNTFRTNPRVLKEAAYDHSSKELTQIACNLARSAREECLAADIAIAGCLAPVADCYEPESVPPDSEIRAEHAELAGYLADGGVDLLLIETMNCIREAHAALVAAHDTGRPYAISFICNETGTLLSGEPLAEALAMTAEFSPLFVGTNCRPPDQIAAGVQELARQSTLPFAVYANGAGCVEACSGWEFEFGGTPAESYLAFARQWRELGAAIIGGCCGTSPEYIAKIRQEIV